MSVPPPESAVTPQLLPSLVPLAHVGGGRAGPEEWTEDWAAEGEGSIPGGSFQAQEGAKPQLVQAELEGHPSPRLLQSPAGDTWVALPACPRISVPGETVSTALLFWS